MLRQPKTPRFNLNVTTDWWTSLDWFRLVCEPQVLKQGGGAIGAFLQSRDVTELVSEVYSSEQGNKPGSNPGFGFQALSSWQRNALQTTNPGTPVQGLQAGALG